MFNIFKNKKGNEMKLNNPQRVEIKWGDETLVLETGRFAKQATGAVMATLGETMVLATVVAAKDAKPGQGFFPLTVDYQEKMAAAGKIPGGFERREGKPSLGEVLTGRLIDRPIRPLFPEGFMNEVQIIATVFAYDKKNRPDVLAVIASSAALALSGVPFQGPIGAARVGYIDGKYVMNTYVQDKANTALDLVVAGTKDGVLMVESEAHELPEDVMLGAVQAGFEHFQPVIKAIDELVAKCGKAKWAVAPRDPGYVALEKECAKFEGQIAAALGIAEKMERLDALAAVVNEANPAEATDQQKVWVSEIIDGMTAKVLRGDILADKPRIDGRDTKTVRPIEVEVGLLPRSHGSSLFTRGETQAIVSLTLGGGMDAKLIDDMDGKRDERFLLNYNFPPFSVGEVGRFGVPKRRELGHGNLAWRALNPVLPLQSDFDFTIRLISDILESNGSSSMATVCGATLALMDGGVPVKAPVAGIAMGLIKEGDKYAILTDILGDEDHLGDMDFKVAGTDKGVTALQMDIKITSITFEIMKKALAQAKDGRMHILGVMKDVIKTPRKEMSKYAPQTLTMQINPDKIREVIGKGGSVIQGITKETNTQIDIDDSGLIKITATDVDNANAAIARIKGIVAEPEMNKIYEGTVSGIKDFGAFVKFFGSNEGLVHISEVTGERLKSMDEAKLKEGQKVFVKYVGMDRGKTRLSMKGIDQKTGVEKK